MPSVRATRGRRRRMLGAAAALALLVCLVSSCGEDSNTGLSRERASNLRSTLDQVENDVAGGDCTGAAEQAGELRRQVSSLPSRVDRDLRDALEGSATRLESLVSEQCNAEPAPVEEAPSQEPTVTDENQGDQQDKPKKDKKPKKPKDGATGEEGSTGVTGQEGSTGVTGQDGGVVAPEGGG